MKVILFYTVNMLIFSVLLVSTLKDKNTQKLEPILLDKLDTLTKVRVKLLKRLDIKDYKTIQTKVTVGILDTGIKTLLLNSRYLSSESDYSGHGTHVAGIILALNPSINLISKRYDYKSDNNNVSFIKALRHLIKQKPRLINISAGGEGFRSDEYSLIKDHPEILFITSAGNDGHDISGKYEYYPAKYNLPNIISVANYKQNGFLYYSSNYGKNVHVGAYGVKVTSLNKDGGLKKMTGTSQAAPMITAMVSRLLAKKPFLSNSEVKEIIKNYSIKNKNLKYGIFNFQKFNKWINSLSEKKIDFLSLNGFPNQSRLYIF